MRKLLAPLILATSCISNPEDYKAELKQLKDDCTEVSAQIKIGDQAPVTLTREFEAPHLCTIHLEENDKTHDTQSTLTAKYPFVPSGYGIFDNWDTRPFAEFKRKVLVAMHENDDNAHELHAEKYHRRHGTTQKLRVDKRTNNFDGPDLTVSQSTVCSIPTLNMLNGSPDTALLLIRESISSIPTEGTQNMNISLYLEKDSKSTEGIGIVNLTADTNKSPEESLFSMFDDYFYDETKLRIGGKMETDPSEAPKALRPSALQPEQLAEWLNSSPSTDDRCQSWAVALKEHMVTHSHWGREAASNLKADQATGLDLD